MRWTQGADSSIASGMNTAFLIPRFHLAHLNQTFDVQKSKATDVRHFKLLTFVVICDSDRSKPICRPRGLSRGHLASPSTSRGAPPPHSECRPLNALCRVQTSPFTPASVVKRTCPGGRGPRGPAAGLAGAGQRAGPGTREGCHAMRVEGRGGHRVSPENGLRPNRGTSSRPGPRQVRTTCVG